MLDLGSGHRQSNSRKKARLQPPGMSQDGSFFIKKKGKEECPETNIIKNCVVLDIIPNDFLFDVSFIVLGEAIPELSAMVHESTQ